MSYSAVDRHIRQDSLLRSSCALDCRIVSLGRARRISYVTGANLEAGPRYDHTTRLPLRVRDYRRFQPKSRSACLAAMEYSPVDIRVRTMWGLEPVKNGCR